MLSHEPHITNIHKYFAIFKCEDFNKRRENKDVEIGDDIIVKDCGFIRSLFERSFLVYTVHR